MTKQKGLKTPATDIFLRQTSVIILVLLDIGFMSFVEILAHIVMNRN